MIGYRTVRGNTFIKREITVGFNQRRGHYGLEFYALYYILHITAAFICVSPLEEPKRHFYPIEMFLSFLRQIFSQ